MDLDLLASQKIADLDLHCFQNRIYAEMALREFINLVKRIICFCDYNMLQTCSGGYVDLDA